MHAILIATAALVGLPILLHLIMKQEPKRLPFPALRFLQQKKRINQRKMRLRHWLLLALRALLIGLFGLALYQPTLFSQVLNLSSEQPVAAVFIIDTSPSMGYTANGRTRLEEARRRALELLDELPTGSRVAVLDPAEPIGQWEAAVGDARNRIEDLKEPRGAGFPLTSTLANAYQLLKTVDEESELSEPMPRLVVLLTDRATAAWDATRTEDLITLRKSIPEPEPAHVVLDVGIDAPADVAIVNVSLAPQVVPQDLPVILNASIQASGPPVADMLITARLVSGGNLEDRKVVALPSGTPVNVAFKLEGLQPGLHQVEIRLDPDRKDALPANDVHYVTFRVAEPRTFLTIADNPADADLWQLAHEAVGEFVCEVRTPADVNDLTSYEAVCLLNVRDPGPLWPKLESYVDAGGKLFIALGPDADYSLDNPQANRLMPGELVALLNTEDLPPSADPMVNRRLGVPWRLDDAALRHPMLAKFRDWKLANYDVVRNPRLTWKYWNVRPQADAGVIVHYDDADDPTQAHPALLERFVGSNGGRVVLLTTRLDFPPQMDRWNNYWDTESSSWYVVFPNLVVRYLAGDSTTAIFNFATGQPVSLTLPRGERTDPKVQVSGPGISGRDAELELAPQQLELRFPASKSLRSGNFALQSPSAQWVTGYSLNPNPEEWTLTKVPEAAFQEMFGADVVVPVEKDVQLRDLLATKFNQPVDLFPWLLIVVLLLVAIEGVVANRFYRPASN